MNEALIPMHRPRFEKSTEKDDDGSLSDLGNPLMTMLSNLGMRVGETSSPNSSNSESFTKQTISTGLGLDAEQKHLLPNGVNVISAEDLENQLRNVDPINQEIKAHQQTFTNFDNNIMKNGIMGFSRTSELTNPPPGFLPPLPGNLLPFSIPEHPSTNLPHCLSSFLRCISSMVSKTIHHSHCSIFIGKSLRTFLKKRLANGFIIMIIVIPNR